MWSPGCFDRVPNRTQSVTVDLPCRSIKSYSKDLFIRSQEVEWPLMHLRENIPVSPSKSYDFFSGGEGLKSTFFILLVT